MMATAKQIQVHEKARTFPMTLAIPHIFTEIPFPSSEDLKLCLNRVYLDTYLLLLEIFLVTLYCRKPLYTGISAEQGNTS